MQIGYARAELFQGPGYPDVGLFEDVARIAERGLFDLIFFGDSTGIPNTWEASIDAAVRRENKPLDNPPAELDDDALASAAVRP